MTDTPTRPAGLKLPSWAAWASLSPRSVKALADLGRTRLEVERRGADALEPLEQARAHAALGHEDQAREYYRLAGEADRALRNEASAPSPSR